MTERTAIAINSTTLYCIAFLMTTIIHELGHAVTGWLFESSPVLHHNYVEHLASDALTMTQQLLVALAGPLISLVQGMVAGMMFLRSSQDNLRALFLLWFAILGLSNFLGYFMTGFVFQEGDIGRIFQLMELPMGVQITLATTAAAALLFLAYKLTASFLRFSYKEEWVADERSRVNFSFRMIILPWVVGSGIVTLAYLPVQAIVSIIYPVMSGFVFIFPWQNARRVSAVPLSATSRNGRVSWVGVGVHAVVLIVFRFVLAQGISF